ncbi:general secretion pathway protein GspK [Coraliomargarita parva]|uniref:general secretion pathway protein GspK n=1 Tax=Coraliomargarita parva TaxID=3014050 RepID=UPI0022B37DCE|nr:type II secretion system protein GspK [Coraliomargarita parva]
MPNDPQPHVCPQRFPNPGEDRRRGSVLVAVLAIILLLTFLVTRMIDETVEDIEYRALFDEPSDVRAFAYSMLEVSLATIQEVALIDEGKLYAPEQGWKDPLGYAKIPVPNGWSISIRIEDEGGKLPINTMSEDLLNRLLEDTLEFDFGESRELSSALLDWIDADDSRRLNGAESEDYLSRNPPYRAANGPLQSLEEVRMVQGWDEAFFDENGQPNEQFQKLATLVSVINTGPVNLNSSPQDVLDLLAEKDGWSPDYLFDGLEEPYRTSPPDSADTSISGAEIGLLRITIRLERGSAPFTLSAVVEPNFSEESSSGNLPGESSSDSGSLLTGTEEEQDALSYPFNILQVNEYDVGQPAAVAARYSTVDIDEESLSF